MAKRRPDRDDGSADDRSLPDQPANSGGTDTAQLLNFNREPPASKYGVDLEKAAELFGYTFPGLLDMFSTETPLPDGQVITAPTHMMGKDEDGIRIISYNNDKGQNQDDVARFIAPGEIAISIKHHSPAPYWWG